MRSILFILGFCLFFLACKTQETVTLEQAVLKSNLVFLDSIQASEAIVQDTIDHFFDRVTITEISIQMKIEEGYSDRESWVHSYKQYLKEDVSNFTKEEKEKIRKVFTQIYVLLDSINPNLKNQDIQLIKTKGRHYGPSVYYTRENKIIIPENELKRFNLTAFKTVMLHEFFHVYSRFNKEKRDAIYRLIGFKELKGPIIMPDLLEKRKLLNPDGTTHYYISFTSSEGKEIMAYPLISANEDMFNPTKMAFFAYLNFNLYELIPGEDGVYYLEADENGLSTLEPYLMGQFSEQIKDNTSYIIHPDEIMADNFTYACFIAGENKKVKNFSEQGFQLIKDLMALLKE